MDDTTALLLKVHPSNYRVEGFTRAVATAELAKIGRRHEIPLCVDLGSGTLVDLTRFGLPHEPTPRETLADGADLVTFSGDKLLGGIQAGIVVGRADLVARLDANPLKRALRLDKVTLALLDATLRAYEDESSVVARIPLLRTLTTPLETLEARATEVAGVLGPLLGEAFAVAVEEASGQLGSGALPDQVLPSRAVAVSADSGKALTGLAARLRRLPVPVIGRVSDGRLWLDMRGAEPLPELLDNLRTLA